MFDLGCLDGNLPRHYGLTSRVLKVIGTSFRDVAAHGESKILDLIGRMSAQRYTMHGKTWTYDDCPNKTNALPPSDRPTIVRSRRELRSRRVVTDFRRGGLSGKDLENSL